MSNREPMMRADPRTIASATTSISPPATWRSIERAVAPKRGWRPSQRTNHRSSRSGSIGSGPRRDNEKAHTATAANAAVTRTASVACIAFELSVGSRRAARRGAEMTQNNPYSTSTTAAKPTEPGTRCRVGHLPQRAVDALSLVRPEQHCGADEEPADEPHHDAAAHPADAPDRHDRFPADRTHPAGLELVTEPRPHASHDEEDAERDDGDPEAADEPSPTGLLHQLGGEPLDPGIVALRASLRRLVAGERQRRPREHGVRGGADGVPSPGEPCFGGVVGGQDDRHEPPHAVERQAGGEAYNATSPNEVSAISATAPTGLASCWPVSDAAASEPWSATDTARRPSTP